MIKTERGFCRGGKKLSTYMKQIMLFLFCLLLFAGVARAIEIEKLLEKAGENSVEVEKFLDESKEKGYDEWAYSLLSAMPDVDLVNLKSDDVISYFDALGKNLDRVSWKGKIDDFLFSYYILPYRVSQEPLENFTHIYGDTLYSIVRDAKDMKEAALRINEWVFTKMKYEPTARWDQNALITIRRGIGRCEEMAILCIKALRTVCIPARDVYTPWWPFTNSNHAWVEVWLDGEWHALGGGELTDLDNAWFEVPSKRAAIVEGVVYGEMTGGNEPIYKMKKGYTIVNVTPLYSDITNLFVQVKNDDELAESASVSICVYNYGSLPPVGLKKADRNGFVKFLVGKTDLFIYAFKDSLFGYKIWRPSSKEIDTVKINISSGNFPDTSFWLYTRRIEVEKRKTDYKANRDSLYLLQQQHFFKINIVDSSLVSILSMRDKKLINIFYNAKGGAKPLLTFYKGLSDTLKDIFIDYFDALPPKDIVSIDTTGLYEELLCVKKSKKLADSNVPDSIIKNGVLSDRILFEHFAKWRTCIQSEFINFRGGNLEETIDTIFFWVESKIEKVKDRGYFGPQKNPEDVYRTKRGVDAERYILITGILRSIGIPSRIKWSYDAIEYWAQGWKERSFVEKKEEEKTWLSLRFNENGEDVTKRERYYYDYSITRFEKYPNRLDVPVDTSDGKRIITIDSKPAHCITGWRNGYGDTYVRVKRVAARVDTTNFVINTGIPEEAEPGDLIVRKYKGFDVKDFGISNAELKKGEVLIIVFDTESEVSRSTLKNAKEAINGFNGMVFLFASANNRKTAEVFLKEMGISKGSLYTISKDVYKKRWGIRELPSVLYLEDGKAIFWVEGLFLHLSRMLEDLR